MTFDDLVAEIKEGGYRAVLATLDPSAIVLMNAATLLFDQFREVDQMRVLALMWGTLCGALDGEPTKWESDNKSFITTEDRMKLFTAIYQVTFDAVMEARKHPDCPQPRRM